MNMPLPGRVKKLKDLYSQYDSVKKWMSGVLFGKKKEEISVATQEGRYWAINKFCNWSRKDADELARMRPEEIEELLKLYWQEHNQHPASARHVIMTLKPFFRHNHIPIEIGSMPYRAEKRVIPTREDVKKMCAVSDLRNRVVIIVLFQSIVRVGTLVRFKYRHIKEDFEAGRIPLCIRLDKEAMKGRVKVRHRRYGPYLGRDAYEALKSYLEVRKRGTQKIEPEIITDESPLIRKKSEPEPVLEWTIRDIVKRAGHKVGLDGVTPHDLRRAGETALEEAVFEGIAGQGTLPRNWIAHITGHVPREAQGKHYSWPSQEKVLEAYQRAEPFLSVNSATTIEGKFIENKNNNHGSGLHNDHLPTQPDYKQYDVEITPLKSKLIERMEEGWDFIKELSTGEYILRRKNGCGIN